MQTGYLGEEKRNQPCLAAHHVTVMAVTGARCRQRSAADAARRCSARARWHLCVIALRWRNAKHHRKAAQHAAAAALA